MCVVLVGPVELPESLELVAVPARARAVAKAKPVAKARPVARAGDDVWLRLLRRPRNVLMHSPW